ncbi:MAG: UDP-3-O-(3-hydroxymyristoyl)glucosamine N-acyltransferase [Nitrospirota bacterium]
MEKRLSEIAAFVNGEIIGDAGLRIHAINTLKEAREGQIAFVSDPKKKVETAASVILAASAIDGLSKTFLLVKKPKEAFAALLSYFNPPIRPVLGVDPRAVIGREVLLGKEISIGPGVVIEDQVRIGNGVSLSPGIFIGFGTTIGEGTKIGPNVTLYHGVTIGKRVIIHAGSVIGADGFGFVQSGSRHLKVPQVGGVIIEDDVELGANVTVDRATLGNTIIGEGTKVDNQVHIGHNVTIGPHTLLVAQVGISGSVTIGHHVILAGQVGVSDHVEIGNYVVVGARSVVTKKIADGEKVIGFPTLPYQKGLAVLSSLEHLPKLRKEVKRIQEQIKRLEEK